MKNVILVFMILPCFILAQNQELERVVSGGLGGGKGDTRGAMEYQYGPTMEEWLYATKGYKDDLSMGKDPSKKGYDFVNAHSFLIEGILVEFIEMQKEGEVRVLIARVIKQYTTDYYAFPVGRYLESVQKSFHQIVGTEEKGRILLLLFALNDYLWNKASSTKD